MSASEHEGEGGREHVEQEGKEGAADKKKGKRVETISYPKVPEAVFRSKDTVVNFDNIEFDYSATQGQARPFSKPTYEQRLAELTEALPTGLVRVTLWPADPLGMLKKIIEDARLHIPLVPLTQIANSLSSAGNIHAKP